MPGRTCNDYLRLPRTTAITPAVSSYSTRAQLTRSASASCAALAGSVRRAFQERDRRRALGQHLKGSTHS
ncbi:hypothetical protein FHU41_001273 [Psychromicrobium silvestre]|uniref:Uncharacterized protein n=1 Tax=Psychromicrobium silvestre TaxID=1645614 RepID=A0A7Y9LT09_9MICC|nr:hypothetical protein [Psychromicrobium silvestre]